VKITIISNAFHPRISPRSFRATELACEFTRQGHDVTVLTAKQNEPGAQAFAKAEGFKLVYYGPWERYVLRPSDKRWIRGIQRLARYVCMLPECRITFDLKKCLLQQKPMDLLVSLAIPYPVHWGVGLARKKRPDLCRFWVADCGDPFIGNAEANSGRPFYFQMIENWFCRKVDAIAVPIRNAVEAYPAFARDKIAVIPQGFRIPKASDAPPPDNPVPTFVYAGQLNLQTRNPLPLLEHLASKDEDFRFQVFTRSLELLEPFKARLMDRLEVHDVIPRDHLLEVLRAADFLINFENQGVVQSPSKLIDYAIVDRPVLSVAADLSTRVVDEFLSGDYRNRKEIPNVDAYRIEVVAGQFLQLMEGVSLDVSAS